MRGLDRSGNGTDETSFPDCLKRIRGFGAQIRGDSSPVLGGRKILLTSPVLQMELSFQLVKRAERMD